MRVHILGICGTFMGGVAALARQAGHTVSGSDLNVYPPMSDQLKRLGIELTTGWDPAQLDQPIDQLIVGNAMTRNMPVIEAMLNRGMSYTSGPAWLSEHILKGKHVVAVAGTHGKTTTSGMVAHILECAGQNPGFLIGGVPGNFEYSARLGSGQTFVVEADEYDAAFFDKRAKFVHYRPRVAILNNLEYDHADIYPDIESIRRQFHHLIRIVPSEGRLIVNGQDPELTTTLKMGVYTPCETFGLNNQDWSVGSMSADGSRFEVMHQNQVCGEVHWALFGSHNVLNALAAIAASHAMGVDTALAIRALHTFQNAKRRLELRLHANGVSVWDDFAHHPTAYTATIDALRQRVGVQARIVAVLEPRSATQRRGVHREQLAHALSAADKVIVLKPPQLDWDLDAAMHSLGQRVKVVNSIDDIERIFISDRQPLDHWLLMSNGGFGGLHERLCAQLSQP
jgi:UDP-N-acetylmuramate: L-alanyl-gamma-D-glutamyl-meso-diaminopimelate ligase